MSDGTWNWHSIVIAIGWHALRYSAGRGTVSTMHAQTRPWACHLAALKQQVIDNEKRIDRLEGRMDAE